MTCIRISNLLLYLLNLKRQTNVKAAQVYFKASKGPHPPLKTMKQKEAPRDSMSTFVLLTLTKRIRQKTIAYSDRHVEFSQGTAYAKSFYAAVYECLYCALAIVRELPHNTTQV